MCYFAFEKSYTVIELGRHLRNLIVQFLDWIHLPFRKHIPRETFQYGATGGINTLLDIFLYWFFYQIILQGQIVELNIIAISAHIAAFLIVFPITFSTGFIMAKYITFKSSLLRGRKQLFRYALTVGGAIFLNYIFLKLFVEGFHLPALGAKVATTAIVVTYSYMLQRYFTFQTGSFKKRPR